LGRGAVAAVVWRGRRAESPPCRNGSFIEPVEPEARRPVAPGHRRIVPGPATARWPMALRGRYGCNEVVVVAEIGGTVEVTAVRGVLPPSVRRGRPRGRRGRALRRSCPFGPRAGA